MSPSATTSVTIVQKKPIRRRTPTSLALEPFGSEQRDAEIDENDDRYREKQCLDVRHMRSNAQTRPSIATVNTMMPTTTRKSATSGILLGST